MYSHLVLLTGMPRSGTSWLSQIFDSSPEVRFRLSPLFSYEFKNQANEASNRNDWIRLFEGAYCSQSDFMRQSLRRKQGAYPTFVHKSSVPAWLVIKDTRFHNLTTQLIGLFDCIRVIALVRNPCGAINSWLQSENEFPSGANPLREWRTGACRKTGYGEYWGFSDWKEVTRMHLQLERDFPQNFKIQSYEQLVLDAEASTLKLFQFCNLPMSEQTKEFVVNSQADHNPDQYAVFKHPSVTERWRTELPKVIQQTIHNEVVGTDLERFWS